jgi:hypothetical protein
MPNTNDSLEMTPPLRKELKADFPPASHSSLKNAEVTHSADCSQKKEKMISSEMEFIVLELRRNPEGHQDLLRRLLVDRKAEKEALWSREQLLQLEKRHIDVDRELGLFAKEIKRNPERYRWVLEKNLPRDPKQYQDFLNDLRARQAQRAAEEERVRNVMKKREELQSAHEEGKAWQEVGFAQVAARAAITAEELTQSLNILKGAEEYARQLTSARKAKENAQQDRLRRAAQEERRVAKTLGQAQVLAIQSQDSFDRHIRYISDCLQANSFGRHHTFPTDGQAVYTKKIRPRIHQIQRSALSNNATFAIQYVGLMALTHVLRLLYVHRGGRIGGETLRYYEADARLNRVDELTNAMLAIFEKVDDNEKQWLRTHQGAAGVLMREMLEVWPMICAAGPMQVQQNLSVVLWVTFRHKPVPSFQ